MKLNFKTIDDLLNIEETELLEFINQPLKPELTKEEEDYLIYIREFIKKNINYVHNFDENLEQRFRRRIIRDHFFMFCYWKIKIYTRDDLLYLLEERRNGIIKYLDKIKHIEEGH